jgi:triphosphoribosyl-dephospho-CoA synthase
MPHLVSPGRLAQVACLLEATARKPGNVHPFRGFADSHYLDFGLSALAIGQALDRARLGGVGAAVLDAVKETRALVATNTNLGMVLLLAPLAAVPHEEPLQAGVGRVLGLTTVEDARLVFEAIRLAQPGGLGSAPEQDVAREPDVTLRQAMSLAAGRDTVARQYVNGFAEVFGLALPGLLDSLAAGRCLETAIVSAHLTLLSGVPDTLIARKRGAEEAVEASRRASEILAAGWPDRAGGVRLCDDLDDWLRAVGNARNPGTTADLVAAALFAGLRDGTIRLPVDKAGWGGASPV